MSSKIDLTQGIRIYSMLAEEPIPRDSIIYVKRDGQTKDIEIFIDRFEAQIESVETQMLKVFLEYYISVSKAEDHKLTVKVRNKEVPTQFLKQLGFLENETGEIKKEGRHWRVSKLTTFILAT